MGRPDVAQPVDGPEFELFLRLMREHRERLVQGELPRAAVEDRARRATTTSCPSRGAWSRRFPDRVLWGTDWPHPNMTRHMPDDGQLVDFIPRSHARRSCSASCWWTTACASTGPRGARSCTRQALCRHSRHDDLRRRAGAAGLSPQPVLHVADEGGEPRALQGGRARLSRRLADDRGAEAGGARRATATA